MKVLASLAQGFGRVAGQVALGYYAAAERNRYNVGWGSRKTGRDANVALALEAGELRERSRQLDRDNPIGRGMFDVKADGVLTSPIGVRPNVEGQAAWNAAALALWLEWSEEPLACDLSGHDDFATMQWLALLTMFKSGECLVVRHLRANEGLPGLRLELVEPDRIGNGSVRFTEAGVLRDGIDYDRDLRPVRYRFRAMNSEEIVTVDARDVIHLYERRRPGQLYGEPLATPVSESVFHSGSYLGSELKQADLSARIFMAVESESGESPFAMADDEEQVKGREVRDVDFGTVLNLLPGESVSQIPQVRPTSNVQAFVQMMLRLVGSGSGLSYEDVSGDYSKANFSAARMSKLAKRPQVVRLRRRLRDMMVARVYEWFVEDALVGGWLPVLRGLGLRGHAKATYLMPGDPYLEPSKEAQADTERLRQGTISVSEIIQRAGGDPDEVLAQIASDVARYEAAGVPVSWFAGGGGQQGGGAGAGAGENAGGDGEGDEDDDEDGAGEATRGPQGGGN